MSFGIGLFEDTPAAGRPPRCPCSAKRRAHRRRARPRARDRPARRSERPTAAPRASCRPASACTRVSADGSLKLLDQLGDPLRVLELPVDGRRARRRPACWASGSNSGRRGQLGEHRRRRTARPGRPVAARSSLASSTFLQEALGQVGPVEIGQDLAPRGRIRRAWSAWSPEWPPRPGRRAPARSSRPPASPRVRLALGLAAGSSPSGFGGRFGGRFRFLRRSGLAEQWSCHFGAGLLRPWRPAWRNATATAIPATSAIALAA